MTELDKIFLTALSTIIGGVFIYASGRIIEKFVIDPIHEYKKTIADITVNLIFYANVYSSPTAWPKENKDKVSDILRLPASELNARTSSIPIYS